MVPKNATKATNATLYQNRRFWNFLHVITTCWGLQKVQHIRDVFKQQKWFNDLLLREMFLDDSNVFHMYLLTETSYEYIRLLNKTPFNNPPLNKGNFDFLKKNLITPPSIRDFLRFYHDLIYTFQHFLYTSYAFFNVISSHKYHFFPGGSAPRPPKSFLAGILYNIPGKT